MQTALDAASQIIGAAFIFAGIGLLALTVTCWVITWERRVDDAQSAGG